MIIPHPEVLLLIGMVALYLYDSTLLLNSNEGILSSTLNGRWSAHFGSERFPLRGKEPFLPNPFLPYRPMFRLRWCLEGRTDETASPWRAPDIRPYWILCPLIWGMALALFVIIPVGLFSRFGALAQALGLFFFYFNAVVALSYVALKRELFGLSRRRVVAIAFESLTCPPFAINMVRHISLSQQVSEDLLVTGRRLLKAGVLETVLSAAVARVRSAIDWEAEGSERADALAKHQSLLSNELKSCQDKSSLPSC